jgi:hypothetical protein
LAVLAFVAILGASAAADAPLPRPGLASVCSPSGAYCALMDPRSWTTRVYRSGNPSGVLWSMPGWFRLAALTDDGETLIAGYDGLNLLPLDYRRDQVILAFYRRGALLEAVPLEEVIADFASLERTLSHYQWGHYLGFDDEGRYVIETVEGRRIAFDGATGEPAPAR